MSKKEEKITLLEYMFIIENDNLWTNIYEFEADLAKFFGEHGVEAEKANTINGQQGRRILMLEKKETEDLKMPEKKETPKIPTKKELVDKVVKKK